MNITQHTGYALRALIYLEACPERRVTIKELAERRTEAKAGAKAFRGGCAMLEK
ncbi:hypothetical protein ACUH78_10480 [Thauera sp. ZXT1-4]|uniref:hypothetical protein n=1 Tax=Thauera sp. ZXT1-4 TaxID=3460294 RepID=UPI004040BDB6